MDLRFKWKWHRPFGICNC